MTRKIFVNALLAFGYLLPVAVDAAIVTYSDKTTFLTATSATDATGPLPDFGFFPTSSHTVGSVTFEAPRFFLTEWTATLPGSDIGVSQGAGDVGGVVNDGLTATFSSAVYSAGFDFMEPSFESGPDGLGCNGPCIDSSYLVRLVSGATVIDSFTFNAPDDAAAFIGVWSDTPFDSLQIRETVGTDDNEYYGHFYSGSVALTTIPLPTAAWLFLSGLLGLTGLKHRTRSPEHL